jgi:hypothetical protein
MAYSLCGQSLEKTAVTPEQYELCPNCGLIVEWVNWKDVEELLSEMDVSSEDVVMPESTVFPDAVSCGPQDKDHNWGALHGTKEVYVCQDCGEIRQMQRHDPDHAGWTYTFDGQTRTCLTCGGQERCNTLDLSTEHGHHGRVLELYNRDMIELPNSLVREWGGSPKADPPLTYSQARPVRDNPQALRYGDCSSYQEA